MDLHQKPPKTTVVAIISKFVEDNEYILLTKRKVDPYVNKWCLPGGHIQENEMAKNAVVREVKEETGLDYLPQFYNYFDEIIPSKDIHAVPLIFIGISSGELVKDNEEVSDAKWVLLKDILLYDLAFQHDEILKYYQANNKYEINENAILHELKYLRDEVLNRFETRNKMIYFAILLAGIILAFGKIEGYILYPILGTILAGLWAHSDIRIAEIGDYIMTQIEPKINGLGWENYLNYKYKSAEKVESKRQERFVILVYYSTYLIMITLSGFNTLPGIIESLCKNEIIQTDTKLNIIILVAGIFITIICMFMTRKFIKKRRNKYISK
jgi:8-oxo-dGTP diphosphatase